MGILCPVILPATCVVPPRNTKFAQRRAVGSELVSHDGGWRDALILQEFSHQLERRLAVSPWLNEDVQDLAFAVHGTPDVQLSAVDGDEHFIEIHRPSGRGRPRLSWRGTSRPVAFFGYPDLPSYLTRCQKCGKKFERIETISEHEALKLKCPKCGSKKVSFVPGNVYVVTSKKS